MRICASALPGWQGVKLQNFQHFLESTVRDRAQNSGGHDTPPVGEKYVAMDAKRPGLGY